MDLSGGLPGEAGEAPADAVAPSVGPDVGPALSRFFLLSAPFVILFLSVLVMWLKKNIHDFCYNDNLEEVEFFDCETYEEYLNEFSDVEEPIEDMNG